MLFGGICAGSRGKIEGCFNHGDIKALENDSYGQSSTGGIVGWANDGCYLEDCYNTGTICGKGSLCGGLIGAHQGGHDANVTIINSYNAGLFDKSASGEFR